VAPDRYAAAEFSRALGEHVRALVDRVDDVDEAVTALLREETLRITHASKRGGAKKTFDFDPYTLLFYKQALYLVGYSHAHREVRALALDAMSDVERRKGARFVYPDDYDPAALYAARWGLIGGARTRVRLRFDADVAPYVARREWHARQTIARSDDGALVMTLDLEGTDEVKSWIFGWGAKVEVLAPRELRDAVAEEMRRGAARYGAARSTRSRDS
jgi:predicted DNA-binding transcriptional regulator YafY